MKTIGSFEIKDIDLAARIGRLYTPHGVLETPALLPVIDPLRQELSTKEIIETGFRAVITNAYLLWLRRREEAIEKGVHELLGVSSIVMTDSGAYQLLRYGRVHVSPREIIEFQQRIGSDIAVILDVPTGASKDRQQAEYGVKETLRRAVQALELIDVENRVWTLPVQGGPYIDLVKYSALESAKLPKYQLYALGSPTISLERYDYSTIVEMVFTVRSILPEQKPLHLFGAGHPMIIPFVVALGVDMFDSASYILYARDDRYMTPSRTYRLHDLDYFPCSCPVCVKREPKDLMELPKPERTRLLAQHNLYVLRQAINEVKTAIREGRLWELLEEKSRAHPSIHTAFRLFHKYVDYLEKRAPGVKGGEVHGIFLYSEESLWRPHIQRHYRKLLSSYQPRNTSKKLVLFPVSSEEKPVTTSKPYRLLKKMYPQLHIVGYAPFLAIIPEELAETYPLSQHEYTRNPNKIVIEETAKQIIAYIKHHNYDEVIVYTNSEEWSRELAEYVTLLARKEGIKIVGPISLPG